MNRSSVLIALTAFLAISALFYFAPIPVGFDFANIHAALLRMIRGEEVYQTTDGIGYYLAPWLTGLLSPFALMNARLGWSIVNGLSLFAVVAVAHRFGLSLCHTALVLLSPPMIYNLLQGQTDALLLMSLFIPKQIWMLAALMKPQTTIGFGFALLRRQRLWIAALLIFLGALLASLFLFPDWPVLIIEMSRTEFAGLIPQNFLPIWPLNLIVFFGLIGMAVEKDDERLYISASPFLMRYASAGSYIGVVLSVFTVLKAWQAALVVFVWWFVLFVR
jgi:hypothetical protein